MSFNSRLKYLETHLRRRRGKWKFCPACGEMDHEALSMEEEIEHFRQLRMPLYPAFLDWMNTNRPELVRYIGADEAYCGAAVRMMQDWLKDSHPRLIPNLGIDKVYRGPSICPQFEKELKRAKERRKGLGEESCPTCGPDPYAMMTFDELVKECWRLNVPLPPEMQKELERRAAGGKTCPATA